jgi:hypothetical protein
MKRIDRVEVRAKLELRRDPYWYRLANGRYLGFRRMTKGKPGTWLARFYDGEKYVYPEDGIAAENGADLAALPEGEQFDAAKRAAERFFAHLEAGGTVKSGTVKAACEAYVDDRRTNKSEAAAGDAEGRFKRLVYDDPIGKVSLAKLKQEHFAGWKKRVLARAEENEDDNPRGSFNRNAVSLKAAMNLAYVWKRISSKPWEAELRPFTKDEDGRDVARSRKLYLSAEARRKLIENASEEAKPLLLAMNLQPVRPGDIPKAKVEDLDIDNRALRLAGKKRERIIPLSPEAFAHFKACARNKLPTAWLVSRADGSKWKKEAWRDEIKLAAAGAKLPRATVAYTLRHSVITDLVKGKLDIFHVAKLAGTSVAMIEKHYGHLQAEHARKALQKLALA